MISAASIEQSAMLKVKIISVGKTKEPWLEEALQEYIKRLSPIMQFETLWVKNDDQLLESCKKENIIALDPLGKEFDSLGFSKFVQQQFEANGSRIAFVIGGPEGLPPLLKKSSKLISLSKLTFTHQIARLVLVEQLYRSFEIAKSTPYHK